VAVWIGAIRPRTLPAAVGPVAAGGGLAWDAGGFVLLPFVAAMLGALLLQVGVNLANDYSDFARGADTSDRIGPRRAVVSELLSPGAVKAGAAVAFALAVAVGVYLALRGGWPIVAVGSGAILAAVTYTGGPWPYGYRGFGDLSVFLFFGPVAVAGTAYAVTLTWPPGAIVAGAGVGALNAAILVINNLRDLGTDAAAGKRTLAVILGPARTRVQYTALLGLAGAVALVGPLTGLLPAGAGLALAAVAPCLNPLRTVWGFQDPRELNPALGKTAAAAGAYGLLLGAGTAIW